MKMKNYLLGLFAVILCSNIVMAAEENENLNGVTMELAKKEPKRGHRLHMRAHEIITGFMLKNGDITQDEIDDHKQQRRLHRNELRRLKKSGDKEAFNARLAEIKERHEAKRKKVDKYIKNHPELRKILREKHLERFGEHKGDEFHGKNHDKDHKRPLHMSIEDDNPENPLHMREKLEHN